MISIATAAKKLAFTVSFLTLQYTLSCAPAAQSPSPSTPILENQGQYQTGLNEGQPLQKLNGHVLAASKNSKILKSMESERVLNLSISMRLNHEADLDQFLYETTQFGNPNFGKVLSSAEFLERFGPTEAQVQDVIEFLNSQQIQVQSVDENRMLIHASGQAQHIHAAFKTEIRYYQRALGQSFYAPAYELQIPEGLAIQGVHGLENLTQAHGHWIQKSQSAKGPQGSPSGTGPHGGLSPSDIRKAYGFSSSLNGSGQTLALFELDGYSASDVTAYASYFALPNVPLQTVLVDQATGQPGDGAAEVTLDIELMMALAPKAQNIIVYEGPNTEQGLLDTYNKIASDNLATSVSSSWGLAESSSSLSFYQSENAIFKQMAAQGQTFYAASGDSGADDNGSTLSVDDPASQPYVVGVGGTTLTTQSDGTYLRESVWNGNNQPSGGAGGGGISTVWTIPAWQVGAATSAFLGSSQMRNVPDVSLNADPSTGYSIYFGGQWVIYGGTSCAAPLWAAFTALVNQERGLNHLGSLGFANPIYYPMGKSTQYASAFHDIHDGTTNIYYPAVVGYDDATGWGSFRGDALISLLSSQGGPAPVTSPSPVPTVKPSAAPVMDLTLKISPSDSTYRHESHHKAIFKAQFENQGVGVAHVPVSFEVSGPRTLKLSASTGSNGEASIQLDMNAGFRVGHYQVISQVVYGGKTLTAVAHFRVR